LVSAPLAFAVGVLAKPLLDKLQEQFVRNRDGGKKSKKGKKKRETINLANLAAGVAAGSVPAHGFLKRSGFLGRVGNVFRRAMGGWLGGFGQAVGVAALIGAAVVVYNKFTDRWTKLGLPTMPITAFQPAEARPAATAYGSGYGSVYRRQDPARTGSLGEYVG